MYESIPQNPDFGDLYLYDDQRLINRRWIYRVNEDIVLRLNNSSIFDVYTNHL